MSKTKRFSVEGQIDLTKVKRGHSAHKSGAGVFKDKRRKTREQQRREYINERAN